MTKNDKQKPSPTPRPQPIPVQPDKSIKSGGEKGYTRPAQIPTKTNAGPKGN